MSLWRCLCVCVCVCFFTTPGRIPELWHTAGCQPGRRLEICGRQRGGRWNIISLIRLHHLQLCGQSLWKSRWSDSFTAFTHELVDVFWKVHWISIGMCSWCSMSIWCLCPHSLAHFMTKNVPASKNDVFLFVWAFVFKTTEYLVLLSSLVLIFYWLRACVKTWKCFKGESSVQETLFRCNKASGC